MSKPTPDQPPRLDDLDFAAMYRREIREQALVPKGADEWDGRAGGYGAHPSHGGYVDDFIARMRLDGARSVLDVGCGPGTLALPLAARVDEVVALDHSPRMLEALRERARERGIGNVRPMLRAWEDDWHDVPVCDIAIASRSTLVADLDAALHKLARHARRQVCLTYPVGGGFVDPAILAAAGVELPRVPDHLLLLGMLHRMGIVARVDLLHTRSRLAGCADFDDFARRLAWTTGPLDATALQRLRAWYDADPQRAARGGRDMVWAFVAWDVERADDAG